MRSYILTYTAVYVHSPQLYTENSCVDGSSAIYSHIQLYTYVCIVYSSLYKHAFAYINRFQDLIGFQDLIVSLYVAFAGERRTSGCQQVLFSKQSELLRKKIVDRISHKGYRSVTKMSAKRQQNRSMPRIQAAFGSKNVSVFHIN